MLYPHTHTHTHTHTLVDGSAELETENCYDESESGELLAQQIREKEVGHRSYFKVGIVFGRHADPASSIIGLAHASVTP